jgi:hypothetical protein
MSEPFIISIENTEPNIIALETSFIDNVGVIEIERFGTPSVNIIMGLSPISVSDLPDIPVSKIIGLDDYLDSYEFDCGTP